MATAALSSPGFWYGVALQLEAEREEQSAEEEGGEQLQEEPTSLQRLAAAHWEDAVACCADAAVLRPVLQAAFEGGEPSGAQLRSLAARLVQRR